MSIPVASWRTVIGRLPDGCRLLDVGIGTGGALVANATEVMRKRLRIIGVDIDGDYVERCNRALAGAGLAAEVEARCESIYDHGGGPYDAIYFSASFMLLPDPAAALRHVTTLLDGGGRIYFTQTGTATPAAWAISRCCFRCPIGFGRVT
jgi:SAM-dependent methyltransferase